MHLCIYAIMHLYLYFDVLVFFDMRFKHFRLFFNFQHFQKVIPRIPGYGRHEESAGNRFVFEHL